MKRIILLIGLLALPFSVQAMNLLHPYDSLIKPMYFGQYPFQFALYGETGFGDTGFDCDGKKVNVLRIWNPNQNALAMLKGSPPTSPMGKLLNEIDACDDGVRGHFCVDADLKLKFAGAASFAYTFCDNWVISAYFPFYSYELKNVVFDDQTQDVTAEDIRVKELLTDNFIENVCRLGGLDLSGWTRTGPGDLAIILGWYRDFPQAKPLLKNVRLNWRVGLGIPTGFRRDEDKLFAFPYGYDGATWLPYGFGLDLTFAFHVRTGFDVQLTQIFGNRRNRRIKTDPDQTQLILLQKAEVYKDFGLTQRFDLYFQLYRIIKGFSFLLGYQYFKHGNDVLSLEGNVFSNQIANLSPVLFEWTMHHMILRADYDFGVHCDDKWYRPQLEVFARLPFNGKRIAVNSTVGAVFSLSF